MADVVVPVNATLRIQWVSRDDPIIPRLTVNGLLRLDPFSGNSRATIKQFAMGASGMVRLRPVATQIMQFITESGSLQGQFLYEAGVATPWYLNLTGTVPSGGTVTFGPASTHTYRIYGGQITADPGAVVLFNPSTAAATNFVLENTTFISNGNGVIRFMSSLTPGSITIYSSCSFVTGTEPIHFMPSSDPFWIALDPDRPFRLPAVRLEIASPKITALKPGCSAVIDSIIMDSSVFLLVSGLYQMNFTILGGTLAGQISGASDGSVGSRSLNHTFILSGTANTGGLTIRCTTDRARIAMAGGDISVGPVGEVIADREVVIGWGQRFSGLGTVTLQTATVRSDTIFVAGVILVVPEGSATIDLLRTSDIYYVPLLMLNEKSILYVISSSPVLTPMKFVIGQGVTSPITVIRYRAKQTAFIIEEYTSPGGGIEFDLAESSCNLTLTGVVTHDTTIAVVSGTLFMAGNLTLTQASFPIFTFQISSLDTGRIILEPDLVRV